jgi:hypothetical protein
VELCVSYARPGDTDTGVGGGTGGGSAGGGGGGAEDDGGAGDADGGVDGGTRDETPPTVARTVPANAATMVVTSTPITVTFDESMNTSSVAISSTPSLTFGLPTWANNDSEVTVAPAGPLGTNQTYTITVTGADVAGNAMASPSSFSFTTAPPVDGEPPALLSSSPANNALDVAVATELSLTFSEAMNTASMNVTTSPSVTLGAATWSNADRTMTFGAAPDWTSSTSYEIEVSGADVAGNAMTPATVKFTTGAPPTPPTVQSTTPPSSAIAVPVNTNIEFNFSKPMAPSVTEGAFSATPAITCVFTWNTARTLMVCNPGADLAFSTKYTVSLGGGATDETGIHLAPYEFSFTTAQDVDRTPPTIASVLPADKAVGVSRTPVIRVAFSESMNKAATQTAFQITSPTGYNGGTFQWDRTGKELTYSAPSSFAYGTAVTWQITNAATDLAGNPLAATKTSTFTVRRYTSALFYATGTTDTKLIDERAGYIQSNTGCTQATVYTRSQAVAGDRYSTSSSPLQNTYRGFLTFDISALASIPHANIVAAYLYVYQYTCIGNPFVPALGNTINAFHVDYGPSLDLADCATPILGSGSFILSKDNQLVWKAVAVTPAVADDFANRVARASRSQFMIRTATWATTGDTVNDSCVFGSHNYSAGYHPYLRIYYEHD